MKKLVSILLAVLLLASLSVTALAENVEAFKETGITLTLPAEYDELLGKIYPYPYGMIMDDPEVYYMSVLYLGVPRDVYAKAMSEEDLTEKEKAMMETGIGVLCEVFATNDVDGFFALLEEDGTPEDLGMTEFGQADGYTFFYVPIENEEYLAAMDETFAEEFAALQKSFPEVLRKAELYAPENPLTGLVGKAFSFETTDLDGNKVTSEELFAQNEITMINYWGTWCGPCRGELAALGEIHESLREKGCGIIGIVEDATADNQDVLDKAKGLLVENGVNYPNIIPNVEMSSILDEVSAFPTSFFVDKTGKILCMPIEGAAVENYENTVLGLLDGKEVASVNKPEAQANGLKCYRVLVYDMDGNPVKGVTIRFCSDDMCNIGKTDADGIARFDVEEGLEYTVHVLKVPEGYANDSGEYVSQKVYSDVTLFLEAAA